MHILFKIEIKKDVKYLKFPTIDKSNIYFIIVLGPQNKIGTNPKNISITE